jgi:hypothetical protein
VALGVAIASARTASAQACCAGSSAITPGRLAVHEDALLGLQLKAGSVIGSHDRDAHYTPNPSGNAELDLEEDLIATTRVLRRAQVTALVPFLETRRHASGLTDSGGGIGDVNLSARYDFVLAGESLVVPGVALLVGTTLPTGRPPESAGKDHLLAADATGVGAFQGSLGLAVEQTFGPIVIDVAGFVAQRAARTANGVHTRLGAQGTFLAAAGYTFPNEAAIALVGTYAVEGDATIEGDTVPGSARRITTLTLSGLLPIDDAWRLQGGIFGNPPTSQLGKNQPASVGLSLTLLRGWS